MSTPDEPIASGTPERIASLDALRAFALLLGVVLHSLMSFGTIAWVVTDVSRSPIADAIVGWIHMFRMPLFFALAGYFARASLARKGPSAFALDRAKRILAPLIVFWPIAVLPVIVVAIAFAITHPELPAAPPSDDPLAIATPAHLWFLWSLTQIYAVAVFLAWLLPKVTPSGVLQTCSRTLARALTGPLAPVWAAIPLALALWLQPTGIVGPATLRPELAATIAFGGAFWVGWAWAGTPDALARIERGWKARLVGAAALTVPCLILGAPAADQAGRSPLLALLTLVAYPLAAWLWVLGLVGLATTHLRQPRVGVRYLADAAYWTYLTHLASVCGFQFLLAGVPWPWPVKAAVVLVAAMAASLMTYHFLVRSTAIGGWLNGRAYPFRWPFQRRAVASPLPEASR